MKKEDERSTHHILPKSMNGSNNTSNLIELKHNQHQALHTLFWTDILPDKIRKLVWIEYTALREEIIVELLKVLKEIGNNPRDIYKDDCIR